MESGRVTLGALTKDEIAKAFQKTVSEVKAPIGKLVLVTEDQYERALEIPKYHFYDEEPTGKSLRLQWSDELENLWLGTLKAGLSLMLINEDNGDVIGLRATLLINKSDKFDTNSFKDVNIGNIVDFMSYGVPEFFDLYRIEEAFHFLGLGVSKKYRKRGVGKFLMETAVIFLSNLGTCPCYIKGEGTSNFSKKIYEKCGFDLVGEYQYENYKQNGKVVFDNTGEHKSMKVYGICVNN